MDIKAFVAILVTGMWAVSVGAEILVDSYATPVAVHGLMGLIAGYFYKGYLQEDRGLKNAR